MSLSNKFFGTLEMFGGSGIIIGGFHALDIMGSEGSIQGIMMYAGIALILCMKGVDIMVGALKLLIKQEE